MPSIILRSSKGSNLTPSEIDGNFDALNQAVIDLQDNTGSGTVTSLTVVDTAIEPVIVATVTNPTSTPAITFSITGSAGYVKSNGSALSTSAAVPVADISGTLPKSKGGTGITTDGTAYQFIRNGSGTSFEYVTVSAGSDKVSVTPGAGTLVFDINQGNLTLSSIGGTLPVNKGGTGQTTASDAILALLPNQASASGKVLTSNGSYADWVTPVSNISVINAQSGASQTITPGTSGVDVNVVSAADIHTINVPDASAASRGALNSTDWSLFNAKIGSTIGIDPIIDFLSNVWYITDNENLPEITSDDIGKILFVKNEGAANYTLTCQGSDAIDGASSLTLNHTPEKASVILQVKELGKYRILASFGTTA